MFQEESAGAPSLDEDDEILLHIDSELQQQQPSANSQDYSKIFGQGKLHRIVAVILAGKAR